jgi:hypothetical protein
MEQEEISEEQALKNRNEFKKRMEISGKLENPFEKVVQKKNEEFHGF